MQMKVAGMFAGIGGIETGLHRAGHQTVLLCEVDPAACSVLQRHFSEVPLHRDVRTLRKLPKDTELVAGGFPCQDLSQAGKTGGISGRNSGLVNEVFRLLRAGDVPHVLLENVSFILALGRGHAMTHVTHELERLGYRWAYRVMDSRAFGLPQRRQRMYLIASRLIEPMELLMADDHPAIEPESWRGKACGFYWTEGVRGLGWAVDAIPTLKGGSTIGIPSSPAIWLPDGRIVTADIRDAERMQGFPEGWTEPAEQALRKGFRWKLVGNAVSVPAAEWLGRKLAKGRGAVDMRVFDFNADGKWPTAAFGGPGQRRLGVSVSMFPKLEARPPLTEFLRFEPKPLSLRATEGFVSRLRSSTLRHPPEFMEALVSHASRMRGQLELAVA
ncbi:MAG TPA: DNA (cytosine-5-)-methyltransferase [Opitutaceae bacterium]|nr:DNA (cytosine-5-)-methyltransferase [Opitutaceae bacterium]